MDPIVRDIDRLAERLRVLRQRVIALQLRALPADPVARLQAVLEDARRRLHGLPQLSRGIP